MNRDCKREAKKFKWKRAVDIDLLANALTAVESASASTWFQLPAQTRASASGGASYKLSEGNRRLDLAEGWWTDHLGCLLGCSSPALTSKVLFLAAPHWQRPQCTIIRRGDDAHHKSIRSEAALLRHTEAPLAGGALWTTIGRANARTLPSLRRPV